MLELLGLGFLKRRGFALVRGISAAAVLIAASLAVAPLAAEHPGDASGAASLERWVRAYDARDDAALDELDKQLRASAAAPPGLLAELADTLSNDRNEEAALELLWVVAERWPDPAITIARAELAEGSAATLRSAAGLLSSLGAFGEDEIRQIESLTQAPEGMLAFDAVSLLSEHFDPARNDPSAFLKALGHSDDQVRSQASEALLKHYYMATPPLAIPRLLAMLASPYDEPVYWAGATITQHQTIDQSLIEPLGRCLERNSDEVLLACISAAATQGPSASRLGPRIARIMVEHGGMVAANAPIALAAFGSVGDAEVEALVQAVQSPNQLLANNAFQALSTLSRFPPRPADELVDAIGSRSTSRQLWAVQTIIRMGQGAADTVDGIVQILNRTSDPSVVAGCTMALQAIGSAASSAIPALRAQAQRQSGLLLGSINSALVAIGDQETIGREISRLLASALPSLRAQGLQLISQTGLRDRDYGNEILAGLREPDKSVISAALAAAATVGPATNRWMRIWERLVELLDHGDRRIETQAAGALGSYLYTTDDALRRMAAKLDPRDLGGGTTQVLAALAQRGRRASIVLADVRALTRPRHYTPIRIAAIQALGAIGLNEPEVRDALLDALEDRSRAVQLAALDALKLIGRYGENPRYVAPALLKLLGDTSDDGNVLVNALGALMTLGAHATDRPGGPDVADTLAKLRPLLGHANADVRAWALGVHGTIGPDARSSLPRIAQLAAPGNPDSVRKGAMNALGGIGEAAAPQLPKILLALRDPNPELSREAVVAIGKIGPAAKDAIPLLQTSLGENADPTYQEQVIIALGAMGPDARSAARALAALLPNQIREIRLVIVNALGTIRPQDELVVRALIGVARDPAPDLRYAALSALANLEHAMRPALPLLLAVAGDAHQQQALGIPGEQEKPFVRVAQAALAGYSYSLRDDARTMDRTELDSALDEARDIVRVLEAGQASQLLIDEAKQSAAVLSETRDRKRLTELLEKAPTWLVAPAAVILVLMLIRALILWVRPAWLVRMGSVTRVISELKLPEGWSWVETLIRLVTLERVFYPPRALDAWLELRMDAVRDGFERIAAVRERVVHVPLPVVVDDEYDMVPMPETLRPLFARPTNTILISGEGGSGKTSIALRVARWAVSDERSERIRAHPMVPVLVTELPPGADPGAPLFDAVREGLRAALDAPGALHRALVERLVSQSRVLIILDYFSERDDAQRASLLADKLLTRPASLIVTSRRDESLGAGRQTRLVPVRIAAEQISPFMHNYLVQRKRREQFTDNEFLDACTTLSRLLRGRDITPLFVKLYAEVLIGNRAGRVAGALPANVPELMLGYLNELNRNAPSDAPDIALVQSAAKILAWECFRDGLVPTSVGRARLIDALAAGLGRRGDPAGILDYLRDDAQLLHTPGVDASSLRFVLDPLAEYLAAIRALDLLRSGELVWERILHLLESEPRGSRSRGGFAQALLEAIGAFGIEVEDERLRRLRALTEKPGGPGEQAVGAGTTGGHAG